MADLLHVIPYLDNFCYLINVGQKVCLIDPGNFLTIDTFLQKHNLEPGFIVSTHHHHDHTGGNLELKEKYGIQILGGGSKVAGIDRILTDGEVISLGDSIFRIIRTPGHTLDSICILLKDMVFTGDTLFTGGCGRIFEGTAQMMWNSIQKLEALPAETKIFCGHNYILDNLEFSLSLPSDHKVLLKYREKVVEAFNRGVEHIPSSIGEEKLINPFFSVDSAEEFGRFRSLKDRF